MILIDKIDFQGDDLYIHYHITGDSDKFVKNRVLVVNWRSNKDLLELLKRIFQNVVQKYLSNEDIKLDWDKFVSEIKTYEERGKNDNK